jgi:hypothetical protein
MNTLNSLSKKSGAKQYYGRAVKAFEEEAPLIQADNVTVDGKTFSLAPFRQENEKALEEVRGKFAKAGCK